LSTFNQLINICPVSASAMPSTGTHVIGSLVPNNLPVVLTTGSVDFIVFGWSRLTTGSGNVDGTDWHALRCPIMDIP
jgi:hypothetical protein